MEIYDNYEEETRERWEDEHKLMIIWKCPNCEAKYRDYPGVNENSKCSCGAIMEYWGESYLA